MKNPITDFYINDQNTENIIVTAKFVCGYVSIVYNSHGNYKNWIAKLNVYRRLLNNKLITEACFFCLDKRNNNLSEEEIKKFKDDIVHSELKINQERWRSAFLKSTRHHLLIHYLYKTNLCEDVINEIVSFSP